MFSSSSSPKPTFRPAATWLRGTTSPELLYVENKWASLIPLAKVADLLQEVLPAEANHETIRRHVQATAERMEEELGEERQLNLFDSEPVDQPQTEQAPPYARSPWASTAATCVRRTRKASLR